jgi:cytoskeletal protein RodZ
MKLVSWSLALIIFLLVGILWWLNRTAPVEPPAPPFKLEVNRAVSQVPTQNVVPVISQSTTPAPKEFPLFIEAPLTAIAPEVARCPELARLTTPLTAEVMFTPTPLGHFTGVEVSVQPAQPYVQACLEDVFAEISFVPNGHETFAPVHWTYRLAPNQNMKP